ncbi:hypothetical protein ABZ815_46345 [Nonomuraea sp. NPDC047529]|uniref:hypothetical protein n=1 Tax=Nonomuraea sp. NPDC047529 TaxID=3155623 RepID=UPI0033EE0802
MLTSQAWRRLAHKTSALGLMGTLAVSVGSVVGLSFPAEAAAPKVFSYTCQGTLLAAASQSISVNLTGPDSAAAGQTFDVTVNIPALTLATAPTAATTLQANAALTPSVGTVQDPGAKTGAAVTTSTSVPAKEVTYKVSVPAGTTGKVSVKPGQLLLHLASSVNTSATCTTTSTESLEVPIGTGGGGTGTSDLVDYECVGPGAADYQDVQIKVEMTMPTAAKVNDPFAIKWKGTYTAGKELKAPTTGETISAKIFAYAVLTGITNLTSATGEGTTGTITAGQTIPLPTLAFDVKATASTAGTVTVKPGKVNFGSNTSAGTQPAIECTVQNEAALKSYTFQVAAGSGTSPTPTPTPTPTPSPTPTPTPKPTKTSTATVTVTPPDKSKTPKAGADTGAGGMAGPDGRLFVLTGTVLIAAAAAGGLVLRRRTAGRG